MKDFLARFDLPLSLGISLVLDLLVLVMAPAWIPAVLPFLAFLGLLFLLKHRTGENWQSLRRGLFFFLAAFAYITYFWINAQITPEGWQVPVHAAVHVLALALAGWIVACRISFGRKVPQLKAPRLLRMVWEWVDAILWALIMVVVVNIFFFQIYEIPSESMVNTYYIGDRPFVVKALSGPVVPLTDLRLPRIHTPGRGEVVVIRNTRPMFDHTLKGEANRFFNDLLFMCTFTSVNLNVDSDGNPLPDPLVKRVIATGGDRVSMVDNQVWVQKSGTREWVKADWAPYVPVKKDPLVKAVRLDDKTAAYLDDLDKAINAIDPAAWQNDMAARLKALQPRLSSVAAGKGTTDFHGVDVADLASDKLGTLLPDLAAGIRASTSLAPGAGGAVSFLRDIPALPGPEAYWTKCLQAELHFKSGLVTLLEAMANGVTDLDDRIWAYQESAGIFFHFFDARNLEPFPADGTIPADHYFCMGDNRYNSWDLRNWSEDPVQKSLVRGAPWSFRYWSYNQPFTISVDDILGFPLFKFRLFK